MKTTSSVRLVLRLAFGIALSFVMISAVVTQSSAKSPIKTDFSLSSESHIGFKTSKFGFVGVSGYFAKSSGNLKLDDVGTIVALNGEIDISSIDTDSKKRDEHLLDSDYFDAAIYPKGEFRMQSYQIISQSDSKVNGIVKGLLTLHGKSVNVELESELVGYDTAHPVLFLKGNVNIKDFGMKGAKIASDEAKIDIKSVWE